MLPIHTIPEAYEALVPCCTYCLQRAPHPRDVALTFDRTGTWTVQVVGRSFDNGHVFEKDVIVEED